MNSNLPVPEEQFGTPAEDVRPVTPAATAENDATPSATDDNRMDFTDEEAALAADSAGLELDEATPEEVESSEIGRAHV